MTAVPVDGVAVRGPLTSAREAQEQRDRAIRDLKAGSKELLRTVLAAAAGIAQDKVEQLAGSFDVVADSGGVGKSALLGGLMARLRGDNPVWGAFTSAFGALSPAMRVVLVLVLVLAIVLLPVTVLLVLLALIVAVIVAAVRG